MMNQGAHQDTGTSAGEAQVRDFYERYPYPQPVDNLDKYRQRWQDTGRRRAEYHLFWPAHPYREDKSILVAGCGTSQAARYALRWPAAQVTGIDFSATSVRYTEQLKRKYNLKNLQVHRLAIEQVHELETSFDQVVCTGVLHHLADPDAGLKALREVLNPDGVMHLMVYAPYGRAGIYLIQEFARRIGIQAAEDEIDDLIAALQVLPRGHPLENLLHEAPDFQRRAALADALLNPQDRAYSVPQLFEFFESAGFKFDRWLRQAPYTPHCGAIASIPQVQRILGLPLREQYAAAELFRGTMVRHSLVISRNDHPAGSQRVDFNGSRWLRSVPIRIPETISVDQNLPPGAAAVLINQSHTYPDIYLPVNQIEKKIYDWIDGRRPITEIIAQLKLAQNSELAAGFFQRLWWYDQVVFDMSRAD